jgi:hypothetical protein
VGSQLGNRMNAQQMQVSDGRSPHAGKIVQFAVITHLLSNTLDSKKNFGR